MWPFNRSENRQGNYSSQVADAILDAASGDIAPTADTLGAVEICAGLWSRAFGSAEVIPGNFATAALTPSVLADIGRELAVRGEAVFSIDVSEGGLRLTPAETWKITGGADPSTWFYDMELVGPTTTTKRVSPGSGVVHVRYAKRPGAPWKGRSPLGMASKTQRLAGYIEANLGNEAESSNGYILAVPDAASQAQLTAMASRLKKLKGGLFLAETTAHGWGQGQATAAPRKDWESVRIGFDPPQAIGELRTGAQATIMGAYGVPLGMVSTEAAASLREQWRLFLHATIAPIGRIVSPELMEKLDSPGLRFNWDALAASDIQSRSRSYKQLVDAGMPAEQAARVSGLA